ncbi:DUF424 family protein [archaeon]|jgi:uncharacterized protein|nr:DUF424 family protein [archaeon]MBT3730517.1 DUF424 family protein [archaeon]MBT4669417.1 DUF424 family protein [archaeon]MBT5029830.1 DUF424 family protein [archaeon]MBT5288043.1 DUF424 family protein [archaeon]
MILVKYHEKVVAIADSDLIGKNFEENDIVLDVSERFYKGEEKTREEIVKILKEENNVNMIGKEIIKIALEEGFINEEEVIKVQGVPHAQMYNVCEG